MRFFFLPIFFFSILFLDIYTHKDRKKGLKRLQCRLMRSKLVKSLFLWYSHLSNLCKQVQVIILILISLQEKRKKQETDKQVLDGAFDGFIFIQHENNIRLLLLSEKFPSTEPQTKDQTRKQTSSSDAWAVY